MQFETRSVQEAISYADWFQVQPQTESVTLKRQTEKPGPPAPSVQTSLQVTWKAFASAPARGGGGFSRFNGWLGDGDWLGDCLVDRCASFRAAHC